MSETEVTETKPGIDRRSALKKAAAAGAIAWSVPTIMSRPALAANGFCTPKCAPTSTLPNVTVGLYCTTTGDKQALLTIDPVASTCPCTGVAGQKLCRDAPASWAKGGAPNFAISICGDNPNLPTQIGPNQIVIAKSTDLNGALGDGTFTSEQLLKIGIGCADRNGDYSWSICNYSITFTFHPGNGSCSVPGNVGTAILTHIGTCTTACTTGACPFTESAC